MDVYSFGILGREALSFRVSLAFDKDCLAQDGAPL